MHHQRPADNVLLGVIQGENVIDYVNRCDGLTLCSEYVAQVTDVPLAVSRGALAPVKGVEMGSSRLASVYGNSFGC